MTPHGKVAVILVVWLALIVFTSLYFYFCEWRLFPLKNRLKEMEKTPNCDCAEAGNLKISNVSKGLFTRAIWQSSFALRFCILKALRPKTVLSVKSESKAFPGVDLHVRFDCPILHCVLEVFQHALVP